MTGQYVAARRTHMAVDGKSLFSAHLDLEQNICPCSKLARAAATVVLRKPGNRNRVFKTLKTPT